MRNLNNTDIEALAANYADDEYKEYVEGTDWKVNYKGFIAGFNAALEELSKEYTEINAYIQNDLLSDTPQLNGRFDILIKRKDLL